MDEINKTYEIFALKSNEDGKLLKNQVVKMEIPLNLKDKFIEKYNDCNVTENMVARFIEENTKS